MDSNSNLTERARGIRGTADSAGGPSKFPTDPVELAVELLRINSINPDLVPGAPGEVEVSGYCRAWLESQGFEVSTVGSASRPTVVGVRRGSGGGRSIMLNGHYDTVGIDSYQGDPFSAEIRDGKLFGRGAFDMKTGMAAIMAAASRCTGLRGDVILTLVADEEFGSLGTEDALAEFSADAAIVTEPTELNVVVAHRAFAWFEIELQGKAAHGSMPEQGVDAIAHATEVMIALRDYGLRLRTERTHELLPPSSVRVSMISGGSDAATVAESCRLTIERRSVPGESPDSVEAELRELLDEVAVRVQDFNYRLTRLVARGPLEANPDSEILRTVLGAFETAAGREATTRGEPFWTDAGLILEAGIPCLLIGVDGGGAHADVEWATTESINTLSDVLEQTIRDFCG
ncbi:MAG: M20/M25/M40 family metallo-hydrolase [Microbacteriaceae bacterium]|nr:M20/M25/M40 family metallo-hydrolase [Microbacteriaceae bacterium]